MLTFLIYQIKIMNRVWTGVSSIRFYSWKIQMLRPDCSFYYFLVFYSEIIFGLGLWWWGGDLLLFLTIMKLNLFGEIIFVSFIDGFSCLLSITFGSMLGLSLSVCWTSLGSLLQFSGTACTVVWNPCSLNYGWLQVIFYPLIHALNLVERLSSFQCYLYVLQVLSYLF